MTLLIKILDFHWDNYQGGSGKSVNLTYTLLVPDNLPAGQILDFVHQAVGNYVKDRRPFPQTNRHSIVAMEVA